jgi:hypothetical protein
MTTTEVPWQPHMDALYLNGCAIAWDRVTMADIREAAPWYGHHAGVTPEKARTILTREWEKRTGALHD